jgi:hypothetical protein
MSDPWFTYLICAAAMAVLVYLWIDNRWNGGGVA